MGDLLQFCTDRELMEELQRRIDASPPSTPLNYGQPWTCGGCGLQVWPNQPHTCPTVLGVPTTIFY